MILFRPVGRPSEVFDFNGALMSKPIDKNPDALNSAKVYFIFVGPNWEQNGAPTAAVDSMIASAKAILSSAYLNGLKQYGSDGNAVFGDFTIDTSLNPLTWSKDYRLSNGTIDHTNNPVWFETDQILSNPRFASWSPPQGDARTSPIYVVVRYTQDGTGAGGGYGGSNNFGPNDYTARAVNVIDVAIASADQVDEFSFVFSHEIGERMSAGIGGLSEVSPDSGGQIADGEPEGADFYAWRLNGSEGPVVTSYWSFLDQAFVVPDGNLERVLLSPIWSGASWSGKCISLRQGSLYEMAPPDRSNLIDSEVQSYAVTTSGRVFDLTVSGQVKEYKDSTSGWVAISGANTLVFSLGAAGNNLYMLAVLQEPGEVLRVWQYSGSGTSWIPLTGTNTTVISIGVAGTGLFMWARNEGESNRIWKYTGQGIDWAPVTGMNTSIGSFVTADANVYISGSNDPTNPKATGNIWQYSGSGDSWSSVRTLGPVGEPGVGQMVAAGNVLCILAAMAGEPGQVLQFGLAPDAWIPLTGPNTKVLEIVVQDGNQLYMLAANDGEPNRVWQYTGNLESWTALTGLNTTVNSFRVSKDNRLHMVACNDGHNFQEWVYSGAPGIWTVV